MKIIRDNSEGFRPFTLALEIESSEDLATVQTLVALAWEHACGMFSGRETVYSEVPYGSARDLCNDLAHYLSKEGNCRISHHDVLHGKLPQ